MNKLVLLIAGFLSGVCASMGLGGGFVLLVYLTMFTGIAQKEAQLMNLVFFLPIAALAIFLHLRNKLIEKKVLLRAILTGVIGVLIGAFFSSFLEEQWLSRLFGVFILFIGLRELFHRKKTIRQEDGRKNKDQKRI